MSHHFIAIVPQGLEKNVDLKRLLGKLKRTVEGRKQEVKWVRPDLWHVTLEFLGNLSQSQLERLQHLLDNWRPSPSSEEFRLQGFGAFPSSQEGRVLWIGVHRPQVLFDLQRDLAQQLTASDFVLEGRDYKPHLTLARFRNLANLTDLIQLGGRKHFGDYRVGEIVLFESVLQGSMAKHIPLYRKKISDNDSVHSE